MNASSLMKHIGQGEPMQRRIRTCIRRIPIIYWRFYTKSHFRRKVYCSLRQHQFRSIPIEAFDLVYALTLPNEATKVMGDKHSIWRKRPQTALDYVSGNADIPTMESELWEIVRNPFPQKSENNRRIEIIRNQLDISDDTSVLPQNLYSELRLSLRQKIKELYFDDNFIQNNNPYIRSIIRRTRKYLEETINPETGEYYLEKIDIELFGENNEEALELMGYLYQAYSTAEEFCNLLSSRVKGGGFMSTLMLKRIGSTMLAGENTAKKMLAWTIEGKELP